MKFKNIFLVVMLFLSFSLPAQAGSLAVKGSTTVLPIMQKAVEAFMKANPNIDISVSGGGSGNGIKALIDGTTSLAMASRFITKNEVKLAVQRGIYPVPYAVGIDALVPIVYPSNPVQNLTIQQLHDIYVGKITNWKEVGGLDHRIVVISRDSSSGTFETWEEKIMHNDRVFPRALLQASNGAVAQVVSQNKYSIGYIGMGYLNKGLKAIKVNGVLGDTTTVVSGQYSIARYLYVFTNSWPSGDLLKFVMYLINPRQGQKLTRAAGYIPLY